jgi:hypothetical protein
MNAEIINLFPSEIVTSNIAAAKGPGNERDFVARMIWDTFDFMDRGELIPAAERLERASRFLRWQEAAPEIREERNRERRKRRKAASERGETSDG